MKKFAIAVAASAIALTAFAAHADEVYSTVGTDGLGIGYGHAFNAAADVRADVNWAHASVSGSSGAEHFQGGATLIHGGFYGDWFPFAANRFRVTAGVLFGADNVSGSLTSPGATYTIEGHTFKAGDQTIGTKATLPSVRPYLGIGYGHDTASKGLSFIADVGVAYGKPKVSFNVPADIAAVAGQTDLASQEATWEQKVNRFKFYPVAKVGVSYRFM